MAGTFRLDRLIPGLEHLDGNVSLSVGVLEGATNSRTGEPVAPYAAANEYGADITVTPRMRGYLHHQGIHLKGETASITIPSRPFMRSTLDQHADEYTNELGKMLAEGMDPETAMGRLGGVIAADVKQTVNTWKSPPNSAATIRRKGRDTPLQDTDSLHRAIDYRVDKGDA